MKGAFKMGFDIKKGTSDLINDLHSKIVYIGDEKQAVIRRLKNAPDLKTKIENLFKTCYEKYKNSCSKGDTIKAYSWYTALKKIGEICGEILENIEEKRNLKQEEILSEDEIKEFLGALGTAELKKEQKKFELRLQHNKLGKSKEEVKLAEFVNAFEEMQKTSKCGIHTVRTPFGDIDVRYFVDQGTDRANVFIYPAGKHNLHLQYKMMSKKLDDELKVLKDKVALIDCMRQYVSQKILTNKTFPEIISGIRYKFPCPKLSNDSINENAAVLCGCLLFAESCKVRNPTRCKWEIKSIEKVKRLIEQDILNPFSMVFAGEAPLYSPAYTPAASGGMKPAMHLVTGKLNIAESMIDEKHNKFFDVLIKNCIKRNATFEEFRKEILKITIIKNIGLKIIEPKEVYGGKVLEDKNDELKPLFDIWCSQHLKIKNGNYTMLIKKFIEILKTSNKYGKNMAKEYEEWRKKGRLALSELES